VELDLSEEQELLRESTARFIESRCPLSTVRSLLESATGMPAEYLHAAAELGWFAMLAPEEYGGGSVSGEGLRDLAIVAEEHGRGIQPGPFVSMNVVVSALTDTGTADQKSTLLPALCRGESLATWVLGDAIGAWAPGATINATEWDDRFELSGHAGLVQEGILADLLLVTAGSSSGVSQFLVEATTPGVTVTPLAGHDITQRLASVSFDQVTVPSSSLLGQHGGAADDVERQLQLACVLSISETIGTMDALFETTRQYAIDRIAFGRPIGSFQAIKHQLADMSLSLEAGKAVGAAAVRAVQERQTDAGEIVSMAKSWVGDASIDIAQGCFQVFGGIGYTWEHDLHLFLRRMTMNGLLFGQSDWHRERICQLNGL
jgi:alkylation response protein AidB-like acyl-CoA dehydrogenase